MTAKTLRKALLSVLAIYFVLPNLAIAQTSSEGLSPIQVAQMEQVNEIAISPSGDKAIFTLSVQADPTEENKPASYHLYLADLSSDRIAPYVTAMSVNNIDFRPNYNSVTFLGSRSSDEPTSLYEISLDGGEAQKIFSFGNAIASYSWAPDGSHLAFIAEDTITQSRSSLPYHPEIYEENLKQRRGYVTNIDKEGHQAHQMQVEGSVYQMQWSPDGERLAIAVAPTPLVDDYYMHQQVMIVDHQGEKLLGKVDHQGKLGIIRWSPNGEQLAMLAGADTHDPIAGRLFVVSSDGGNPTQLQPQYEGMFDHFKWTGNNTLHYLTSEGVWSTYGSINDDGTNMNTIVGRGEVNLSAFARSSDGTTIFRGSSSSHPQELFRLDSESDELVRVTNSNSWLDDVGLGRQEAVTWTAEDGTELQGILIYPVNFEKGQKYPLITTVHGGPESHYDHGWVTGYSDPGQVGAAQGYFVFYPNYRGSTGRGEKFAKSSQADMAGAEFDDIVAGVDELIDVGLADSAKVGVTGGSYGGYATGWMATRYTDRFAGGVMFVGISNNISKWGTSDIPEELYLVHARERIWEDYQDFLERSPIYYAGQAETPLLILAGKEDTRVDPGQSYELYRHIKTRTETPVRLVLYPEEGHGNINATARLDYNLRMMRWFNKYLKDAEEDTMPDTKLNLENETIEN
jgi:dipeptidyl aminopeptidase/acylaminoacyl peptidase